MVRKAFILILTSLLLMACQTGDNADRPSSESSIKPAPTAMVFSPGLGKVVRLSAYKTELNPTVKLDRTRLLAGQEAELFLMVKFDIPEGAGTLEKRPDLALSMVLDHSGSMGSENKMGYAKEAASYGVGALKPTDKVAVVEYDDDVSTIWPLSYVASPSMIQEVISAVQSQGGTNLCGGMDAGITQLSQGGDPAINRVILLSDGQANSGIINPQSIAAHARAAYKDGITISTMGVGTDYNEDLMQLIAEAGGGSYYFIENPASIKSIFEDEMGRLFTMVAQDISISLEETSAITSYEIVGDTTKTKQLASLYGGEQRVVIFKLLVKAQENGEVNLGNVSITYDVPDSEKSETVEYALVMDAIRDSAQVKASVVKEVRAEAILVETEEIHEKSVKLYEQGRKNEALAQIKQQNDLIKSANLSLKDARISSKSQALDMENQEMEEADQNAYQRNVYLKRSKERSYTAKKGKRGKIMIGTKTEKSSVLKLQRTLQSQGLYSGTLDGVYTEEVKTSVAEFQRAQGLAVDSVAGPLTLKKLGLY